ncbi:bublin coiled-coil protein isoform X1 [Narcine bancroftii]|uniref:bublin coiled-coil protein isoform X1 n=1 Tax=Narcine bancroftii TaxID=1343680 RepID=UPI0038320A91
MSGPNGEPAVNVEREEDDVSAEEYDALNLMLDQISSCLDNLEEKNDVLNAKFQELLESNRQARLEFRQQQIDTSVPSIESKNQKA